VTAFSTKPSMSIDVEDRTAVTDLKGVAARAADMRPAMRRVAALLAEGNRQVFETKGAAIGEPWPASSPGTLARKARTGVGALSDLMVDSGDLEHELVGGNPKMSATRTSARAGTRMFYAKFAIKSKHEPARPPVGIPQSTRKDAFVVIEEELFHGGGA
jgi:hypothetical protein